MPTDMSLPPWLVAPILFALALAASRLLCRKGLSAAPVTLLLAAGWAAIVLLEGGGLPFALIGPVALLPLLARGAAAASLRMAASVIAAGLLIFAHRAMFNAPSGIALLALVAAGMLAFVARLPETNKIAGVEGAHLAIVAAGLAIVAIDMLRWGAPLALPAMLGGAALGFLLAQRPFGSAVLPTPLADAMAIMIAALLGECALAGAWAPAFILGSIAALEITIWLLTAARADRSNPDDRPRGAFGEAVARKRDPRSAMIATFIAGAIAIVLALGASQGEWLAGLIGAAALMWLFQRYLWRQVPERRYR